MRIPSGIALRAGRRLPPSVRRWINAARGIDTPALVDLPPGRKVLVLAPHPDDELLGCGGALIKHIAAGHEVAVVMLTSGEATAGMAGRPLEERRARREGEALRACGSIGLAGDRVRFLRLPDGGLAGAGDLGLPALLAETAPDLVYAPFPFDAHADHRAAAKAAAAALAGRAAQVALYEVWTPLPANTVVDVTAQMEAKLAALACYESALGSVDYLHTARGLGAYRAAQGLHGRGYAEAFMVVSTDELVSMAGNP